MTDDVKTEEPKGDPELVNIITTDRGTFGPEGIAPIGTRRTIHFTAFAPSWMNPASVGDASRLKKLLSDA